MKTQRLGRSELEVSRLAYGCMRIAGTWDRAQLDEERTRHGIGLVEAAFESGYTFFDHADIYGDTACETVFGRALALHPGWREQMVVATKCGIRWADRHPGQGDPYRYDFSYEHIVRSAEGSLRRLGIETIDLLQLHRPDLLADPEEIARAFTELRAAGKVREFGVSNFRPTLVTAVQRALPFALVVNQVEIHLGRLDCLTDGTLDQCLELGLTPLAWSPLGGGKLATGAAPTTQEAGRVQRLHLLAALDETAAKLGADRSAVALAWLTRHPSRIIPIVGSADAGRIRSMAAAADLELDRATWYRLTEAARGERMP